MEFLKSLFDNGALTWDEFSKAVTDKGFKIADLKTGDYVSKAKYDDAISTRDTSIKSLNEQIASRTNDIENLTKQLKDASGDSAKVQSLTADLQKLQEDIANQSKDFASKMKKQSYEFAVKEYAQGQKFTSVAAQKQFISEMINKNLKFDNDKIDGADDFLKTYKESNADSFVVEPEPNANDNKPMFGQPTQQHGGEDINPFIAAFNFAGVPQK